MNEMITVKEFNRRQLAEWRKGVDEWKMGEPFPYLPKYLFIYDNGKEIKMGYVVLVEGHRYYFKRRREALECFEKHERPIPN